jgi:hypothetical protein
MLGRPSDVADWLPLLTWPCSITRFAHLIRCFNDIAADGAHFLRPTGDCSDCDSEDHAASSGFPSQRLSLMFPSAACDDDSHHAWLHKVRS